VAAGQRRMNTLFLPFIWDGNGAGGP
jgi:hypothetical protein